MGVGEAATASPFFLQELRLQFFCFLRVRFFLFISVDIAVEAKSEVCRSFDFSMTFTAVCHCFHLISLAVVLRRVAPFCLCLFAFGLVGCVAVLPVLPPSGEQECYVVSVVRLRSFRTLPLSFPWLVSSTWNNYYYAQIKVEC